MLRADPVEDRQETGGKSRLRSAGCPPDLIDAVDYDEEILGRV
jgi:hypothetical protein